MPRFMNIERDYYLHTSCKVLYTTLTKQSELSELSNVQFFFKSWIDRLHQRKRQHFMLVRNPYDRVVSCYADKFHRQEPALTADGDWQPCQKLFFTHIGLSENDTKEKISERLYEVSFNEFVYMLPNVHRKDGHYYPQYFMLHPRLKKRIAGPRLTIRKLFRIEFDLNDAAVHLGLDFVARHGQSSHGVSDEYYDAKTRYIVNSIYRPDFEFGYTIVDDGAENCP